MNIYSEKKVFPHDLVNHGAQSSVQGDKFSGVIGSCRSCFTLDHYKKGDKFNEASGSFGATGGATWELLSAKFTPAFIIPLAPCQSLVDTTQFDFPSGFLQMPDIHTRTVFDETGLGHFFPSNKLPSLEATLVRNPASDSLTYSQGLGVELLA